MTATDERRDRWLDERYQQLVELAPDGILVHNGERIVLANTAALRLLGASRREQVIGQMIDIVLEPPHLKAVQGQLVGDLDAEELAPPVRDTVRRLDGSEVEVEVRAIVFMDRGRPAVHLTIRDITERLATEQLARQVDERLQKAQRMESLGALAGGVAHEVNNMMSVILGFGAFVLENQGTEAENLADVREMVHAAERAAVVTHQLLAFSRTAVHQPKLIDLGDAVRIAELMIRRLLGEDRQLILTANAGSRAWIDPGQLEEVIVNLVLNARHATPPGGTIAITAGDAHLERDLLTDDGVAIPAGAYATLRVRDTGTGMDEATIARIFEPFFTTKSAGEGTGLGLAAVQGIVAQNGGYITVTSAPGEGATFTLYLPVRQVSEGVELPEAPASAHGQGAQPGTTVLVVDDERAVRAIAARSLERGGFHVIEASDGKDALDQIDRTGRPQLILTDVMMPGIGGIELARHVKARWPTLPILFMSGYSAEAFGDAALGAAGPLVQKPFTPSGLVKAVTAALALAAIPDGVRTLSSD